ncbi:Putative ABC transporter substrate binding protein [Candidatus Fokinia solitaria]|uniref:ABC transporter substrate binding protein n=1 Tax=Candidatus Fokinia solitaria TaxID=1802984 RepID=A0A2U8BT09_9RICK|nr:ABC transporter substrate-binding protein [Candidatus Fokinia solitaria]AWD33489.1 Putative ABC transporter substrate binding protein [Candidatus Fokinia solitaria]
MIRYVLLKVFVCYAFIACAAENTVLILKSADHPALDIVASAIQDTVKDFASVSIKSAQGNIALAHQIASQYFSSNPKAVVGVGTMAAQMLLNARKKRDTLIVFSSVTEPYKAGLLKSKNVAGVSNFLRSEKYLAIITEMQPLIKSLGILYNPSEINSQYIVDDLSKACSRSNIKLVKRALLKVTDVNSCLSSMMKEVDAVIISNDNTALSAISNIAEFCKKNNVPLYCTDVDTVYAGVLGAIGPNQYKIGVMTGELLKKSFNNEEVSGVVLYPEKIEIAINELTSNEIGFSVPSDVLQKASIIVNKR